MPSNSRIFEIPKHLLNKKNGFAIDFGKIHNYINAIVFLFVNKLNFINKNIIFTPLFKLSDYPRPSLCNNFFTGHTLIKLVYISEKDEKNRQVS